MPRLRTKSWGPFGRQHSRKNPPSIIEPHWSQARQALIAQYVLLISSFIHRYFSICLLIRHDQSVSPCFNVFINLFAYCPSILPPTRLFNAQSLNHSIIFNPCIHPSLPQSIQHSINQSSKQLNGGFKHERFFSIINKWMSSFPLTNSIIFQRARLKRPTR